MSDNEHSDDASYGLVSKAQAAACVNDALQRVDDTRRGATAKRLKELPCDVVPLAAELAATCKVTPDTLTRLCDFLKAQLNTDSGPLLVQYSASFASDDVDEGGGGARGKPKHETVDEGDIDSQATKTKRTKYKAKDTLGKVVATLYKLAGYVREDNASALDDLATVLSASDLDAEHFDPKFAQVVIRREASFASAASVHLRLLGDHNTVNMLYHFSFGLMLCAVEAEYDSAPSKFWAYDEFKTFRAFVGGYLRIDPKYQLPRFTRVVGVCRVAPYVLLSRISVSDITRHADEIIKLLNTDEQLAPLLARPQRRVVYGGTSFDLGVIQYGDGESAALPDAGESAVYAHNVAAVGERAMQLAAGLDTSELDGVREVVKRRREEAFAADLDEDGDDGLPIAKRPRRGSVDSTASTAAKLTALNIEDDNDDDDDTHIPKRRRTVAPLTVEDDNPPASPGSLAHLLDSVEESGRYAGASDHPMSDKLSVTVKRLEEGVVKVFELDREDATFEELRRLVDECAELAVLSTFVLVSQSTGDTMPEDGELVVDAGATSVVYHLFDV